MKVCTLSCVGKNAKKRLRLGIRIWTVIGRWPWQEEHCTSYSCVPAKWCRRESGASSIERVEPYRSLGDRHWEKRALRRHQITQKRRQASEVNEDAGSDYVKKHIEKRVRVADRLQYEGRLGGLIEGACEADSKKSPSGGEDTIRSKRRGETEAAYRAAWALGKLVERLNM